MYITIQYTPRPPAHSCTTDEQCAGGPPENAMKWESIQASPGNFTFQAADAIANFARERDLQVRCHTLVWYSQLPAWVSDGSWTNETLLEVVKTHVENVVGRYRGVCTHWDVVNEGEFCDFGLFS